VPLRSVLRECAGGLSRAASGIRHVCEEHIGALRQQSNPRQATPRESGCTEEVRALDETIVSEGIGTPQEIEALRTASRGRSVLRTLVESGRIDEARFTSIWSRHSGLRVETVIPEDIDPRWCELWPESLARTCGAMPFGSPEQPVAMFGFVEPPSPESQKIVERHVAKRIEALLITPSNLLSLCDEMYPARLLKNDRPMFQSLLDCLRDEQKRAARTFQMLHRVSLGEAIERTGATPPSEIREINALALQAEPVSLEPLTLSIPLIKTLTPLFCELHGILPLSNGTLAINNPPHPDTIDRIHDILGDAAIFQCDTPAAFSKLWRDFTSLRFSQDALLEHLLSVEILSIANAERIREARRLLSEPLDMVLLRLGLASPRQVFHAIRSTSALDIAESPANGFHELEGILSEEHRACSGITPGTACSKGVTFHTSRLPMPEDSTEIMRRCNGIPWKFELSTTLRDSILTQPTSFAMQAGR